MKKYDVIALGELLIDFTDYGISEQTNPVFEANPGGAPCNVLALLKKYDRSCAFIGKIGEDLFGKMLTDILDEIGIDHKGLIVDPYYNTTLAFVKNFENGDREFSFYRHRGACNAYFGCFQHHISSRMTVKGKFTVSVFKVFHKR